MGKIKKKGTKIRKVRKKDEPAEKGEDRGKFDMEGEKDKIEIKKKKKEIESG